MDNNKWRTDANLPSSFFFDRSAEEIEIIIRSPSGAQQRGYLAFAETERGNLKHFVALPQLTLKTLLEKEPGWSWKLVGE